MACGDHQGHPHPFGYPETIKSDGMRRPSWSSVPSLLSRDNQVRWHAETIMVIRFHCFRDYFSLLCHLETIKSDGMQRQLWSYAFFYIWKTTMSSVIVCFQKETMTFIYISKTTMSLVIACFKKATMTLIYISKTTISSVIACFQKATMTFIYAFEDGNVFISNNSMSFVLVLHRTQRPLFLCFKKRE